MMRPIEIVGGGLAGLALGCGLRRDGIPVIVREAGAYPRHRVCGEFIAGLGARTIARLGVEAALSGAVRHDRVSWHCGGRRVREQRLPSPALGLSRHALDARLAELFVARGGQLEAGVRILSAAPSPGRVLAVGRKAGPSPWIGLKAHAVPDAAAGWPKQGLEVHLGCRAYAGMSAVEDGRWNVCGLFDRSAVSPAGGQPGEPPLLRALRASGLEALAGRIAPWIDPASECAVAGLTMNRTIAPSAEVAVGDHVAMIPPFTGNGMAMALQGAELALAPLGAYSRGEMGWNEAGRVLRRALRRRFGLRLASAGALHPYLLSAVGQKWLARAARARLLPLRPLYILLH